MKVELTVEELLMELEQSLNSMEFMHGCLTDKNHAYQDAGGTHHYAYPKMTEEHIERLRAIVGERHYCLHGAPFVEGCKGCEEGHRKRQIIHRVSEKIGIIKLE